MGIRWRKHLCHHKDMYTIKQKKINSIIEPCIQIFAGRLLFSHLQQDTYRVSKNIANKKLNKGPK